jgi:hypothetical protein
MTQHELMPAITLMERKVDEAERKVNELLGALNVLRGEVGMPPRPRGGGGGGEGAAEGGVLTQIKPDTFFGQKQQTALRSLLEMRRAQGLGPGKPRELYEGLLAGGYQFEAQNAETAIVGMRALLRKRTAIFTKLQNGAYGLTAWYPHARKPRSVVAAGSGTEVEDDAGDEEGATEDTEETTTKSAVAS